MEEAQPDTPSATRQANFVEAVSWFLTPRQVKVVKLIAEGKTTEQIAEVLHMDPRTVGTERAKIATITDCDSVAEVVRWAIRQGVIEA